jgi:Calcium binding
VPSATGFATARKGWHPAQFNSGKEENGFSDRMEDMTQKKRKPVVVVHMDVRKLKPEPETNLPSVSKARLEKLIAEAVVDAYTEQEQAVGFLTMIQDHLVLPFSVNILGVEAVVEKVDMTRDGRIVAVCRRENIRQRIGILDLALPTPPPTGAEWIAAYHHWRRGF